MRVECKPCFTLDLDNWIRQANIGANWPSAPSDPAIARYAVDSYLKDGNAKAAIDTIQQFQRRAQPDSDLLVQLTKAHLALN